jgi:hypothetical protein
MSKRKVGVEILYGSYLVMERRKKLLGAEYYCNSVHDNLLVALLYANGLNSPSSHGSREWSNYYVRQLQPDDVTHARRCAIQREPFPIDLYSYRPMYTAEEILARLEQAHGGR